MIVLILIALAVLIALLEQVTADWALDDLHYTCHSDKLLAEPGEEITLTTRVENRGRLPVPYLHLLESLPRGTEFAPDLGRETRSTPLGAYAESTTWLLPRRRWVGTLRFSLPRRGWYRIGTATLYTGDLLGLRESTREVNTLGELVIIPRRCQAPEVLRALGGFLGSVSVRRFILEDPVLTVGFREYTGREPMKAISWPQSARMGRLLVKEFDYTADPTITVLLNVENGQRDQVERCFSLARTVCEELEDRSVPYDLRTNADLVGPMGLFSHLEEGLGRQHLRTLLYGLGKADTYCHFPLVKLVEDTLRADGGSRGYLVITPEPDGEQRRTLERLRAAGGEVCVLTDKEVGPWD